MSEIEVYSGGCGWELQMGENMWFLFWLSSCVSFLLIEGFVLRVQMVLLILLIVYLQLIPYMPLSREIISAYIFQMNLMTWSWPMKVCWPKLIVERIRLDIIRLYVWVVLPRGWIEHWLKRVKCLLSKKELPKLFGGESFNTIVQVPSLSPYQSLQYEVHEIRGGG